MEEGVWKNGELVIRNGEASHTYEDGATYVGEWKDNVRQGQGTFTNQLG